MIDEQLFGSNNEKWECIGSHCEVLKTGDFVYSIYCCCTTSLFSTFKSNIKSRAPTKSKEFKHGVGLCKKSKVDVMRK